LGKSAEKHFRISKRNRKSKEGNQELANTIQFCKLVH
jgi:hypothetical protein